MKKYRPKDSSKSPRFCGNRTFMRLPEVRTTEDVDAIITGIPFDTGCSFRNGARFGPQSVREASLLLRPYNMELDVNIFDYLSATDYGDIDIIPGYIQESYKLIVEQLKPIYTAGVVPICVGGDHSISLGELRAIKESIGPVAFVHFDSHTDTWDDYWGMKYAHGTPFRRAFEEDCLIPEASIQLGMRGPLYKPNDVLDSRDMGFVVLTAGDIHREGIEYAANAIKETVGESKVFVTFDIDFLDPAYAPGTGTPEIGGFSTWETCELIRKGLRDLDIIGFDLVEVLPDLDPAGITSFAAAGIIFEFLSLLALRKKVEIK